MLVGVMGPNVSEQKAREEGLLEHPQSCVHKRSGPDKRNQAMLLPESLLHCGNLQPRALQSIPHHLPHTLTVGQLRHQWRLMWRWLLLPGLLLLRRRLGLSGEGGPEDVHPAGGAGLLALEPGPQAAAEGTRSPCWNRPPS